MMIPRGTANVVFLLFCVLLSSSPGPLLAKDDQPEVAAPQNGSVVAQGKIIPPDQWLRDPCWSPDGAYITVQSHHSGNTESVVLRSSDYSELSSMDAMYFPKWSPNNKLIAAHNLGTSGFVKVYDGATGTKIKEISGLWQDSFAWSPDGDRLLVTQREAISICDIKKNLEIKVPVSKCECNFQHPAWSPDGRNIAASCAMKTDEDRTALIRIWNAETGEAVSKIEVKGKVGDLSWSPDGRCLLYSELGSITLVDATTYKELRKISSKDRVRFEWSPTKKQLSFRDSDCVHILDAQTFNETIKIQGPTYGYFSFGLSPDERFLQLSGRDTIAICDAKTGKYLGFKTVKGTYGSHWTPDGKAVAIRRQDLSPDIEQVSVPTSSKNGTVFVDGKNGSPGWENNPSPKNLEECFTEFDRGLSKEGRERFKNAPEDRVSDYGGGSILLDSLMDKVYGYWGLIDLEIFFERYGITDPRDVFGIVLDSYWRHLNSKPIEFEEQARKHKAWWDSEKPVVSVNKQLPSSFFDLTAEDSHFGPFSIGSLKGKLKIVSLIDTDSQFSASYIKSLKDLRARYPSKDLSFVVFVVPPELLTNERWPAVRMRMVNQEERPAKEIAAFQSSTHDGIIVAPASEALVKELFQFVVLPKYSEFGPPQTLILTGDGLVKLRLNGIHKEGAVCGLESEIKGGRF